MSNTISAFSSTSINPKQRAGENVTENGTAIVMPGEEASKDLFLKMLVAQMQNQDPFNPQDPTQYITQLAQFTQMEQMMSLNENMEYLAALNDGLLVNSAMGSAAALIGKDVEVYKPADYDKEDSEDESVDGSTDGESGSVDESTESDTFKGKVESVEIKDGVVYMNILDSETQEIVSVEYAALVKVEGNKNTDV